MGHEIHYWTTGRGDMWKYSVWGLQPDQRESHNTELEKKYKTFTIVLITNALPSERAKPVWSCLWKSGVVLLHACLQCSHHVTVVTIQLFWGVFLYTKSENMSRRSTLDDNKSLFRECASNLYEGMKVQLSLTVCAKLKFPFRACSTDVKS